MSKPVPKHWKKKYNIRDFESYKDIPGWMNDTEIIYKEMVDKAQDGDHFVEIGTFLGQSTSYMAELIKKSKKKISFDAIDLYWLIPHTLKNYEDSGHPKSFYDYYNNITKEWNLSIIDIVKHPMRVLDVDKYVNFITCEEQYAYRLYDDDSLKFVWIDGDHGKDIVYNDLKNFWPKIKSGGTIGGDDIVYEEVLDDVKKFSKEYNVKVKYKNTDGLNSFLITKE
jgi:predicted O-methyltransferase YrrM